MAHLAMLPAGYVHGFFISSCGFFFCFASGGRQECLFILSDNFLQPNADLPYKKEISCLSGFKFLLNCVMQDNRKFHFVRLFPPVEHIIVC